ncbi:exo-beta-N-acetylmuramidase NamZ family protein [Rasiella sp. SM2506]|uniref:exo-beta-N-acetylmuramidase NamZ family protein n=1 Tax=Rasiella sp. SM2506 TaxID=3423914 RepID=UPI003D7B9AC9
MRLVLFKNTILILSLAFFSCGSTYTETNEGDEGTLNDIIQVGEAITADAQRDKDRAKKKTLLEMEVGSLEEVGSLNNNIITGAEQPGVYFPLLNNKKVGVVANQTSVIIENLATFEEGQPGNNKIIKTHIVDYMSTNAITITKVFAPEHGFRGTADAGEVVKDGIDTQTGLPIISLYGNNKKPSKAQLEGIDIMVFDIQDVGARFYTYISTLHYVMEACAEQGIPLLILDRPNPNGHYIDGPILEPKHASFVGMHPVPVVHGMTIGEYAQMINGEKWLANGVTCDITIIKNEGYTHKTAYSLPVNPSPNLPNTIAISLYPSLCFFEGTFVSAGRGTNMQFQVFGAPSLPERFYDFTFTPQSNEGSKSPKFKGEVCHGKDLRNYPQLESLNLDWLIEAYVANGKKKDFFNSFFTKLAGTETLQEQIEQGYTAREIKKTWQEGLKAYEKMRKGYLLYE